MNKTDSDARYKWFIMRTNIHWAMKSQQPFNVVWTIEILINIDNISGDSVLIDVCRRVDKNDILTCTDRIVTYLT